MDIGLELFDTIRPLLPLSMYEVKKKYDLSYSSLKYFLDDLERAKMIKTEIKKSPQNRKLRMIFLNTTPSNKD